MAHALHHAESSARKFGGAAEDYLDIHTWFDAGKAHEALPIHRALRHHSFRNGPVDVKDSVFTLKNPGTDEGSGVPARRSEVHSGVIALWRWGICQCCWPRLSACLLTVMCLRRARASVRGQRNGCQLHTLSGSVPECRSSGRAQPWNGSADGSLRTSSGTASRLGHWWAGTVRCGRTLLVLKTFQSWMRGAQAFCRSAIASSRVKRNPVPSQGAHQRARKITGSTHIRCSTTPMRRASATVARLFPRRSARRSAQDLSQFGPP